jgi:hypothetical protein
MPEVFRNRNRILAGTFNTFSTLLFWFRFCYFWVTSDRWKIGHGQSNKGLKERGAWPVRVREREGEKKRE